jgi:hypothetical protein
VLTAASGYNPDHLAPGMDAKVKEKHMAGQHDLFVNIIGEAIRVGGKVQHTKTSTDNAFYAGAVSAHVNDAAMVADILYSADYEATRHALLREVEGVHLSWSDGDLADAGKVGNEATRVAAKVLDVQDKE